MYKWLASLFTLFFATTSLQADSCPPADPCAPCAQLSPTGGPDWIITPNAGPCVECGVDLFITAEFIYWTAREDHLAFAAQGSLQDNLVTPEVRKGKVAEPGWKFSPGFKVGLGFITDHDGWDLYANYTWLRPKTSKKKLHPVGDLVVQDAFNWIGTTTLAGTNNGQTISKAEGKWALDFNVVDLELGRNFFISRYLKLRPHFGLKGTWQKQRMDTKFKSVNANGDKFVARNTDRLDYWGIGIRGGLDTSWHFNTCFSLFGELAISNLWERFEVERKSTTQNLETRLFSVPMYLCDNFHTIKPVIELFLGLRYEDWFCCDTYHMSIEAGWEEQWWSDQNQLIQYWVETRGGDLFLQGLTVKLRFDF